MASSSWFGSKTSRRSSDKQRGGKRTLRLESLEERRMMAADLPTAWVTSGTLYINGTNNNDHIEVSFANNRIAVSGIQIKDAQGQMVSSVSRSEVPYQVIAVGQFGDDYIAAVEAGDKALPCIFYGSQGNDTLIGGSADDALIGMEGVDVLIGNGGNDRLVAALFGDNHDLPQNNTTPEILVGGDGDDQLIGSMGMDYMWGGDGNDTLIGSGGDDWLSGGTGMNSYDGGDGVDTLSESALLGAQLSDARFAMTYELPGVGFGSSSVVIAGIEKAALSANPNANGVTLDASAFHGSVQLYGSAGDDVLKGGAGNDRIFGLAGNDQLTGGAGSNYLDGGAGDDTLVDVIAAASSKLTNSQYTSGSNVNDQLVNIEAARLMATDEAIRQITLGTQGFSLSMRTPATNVNHPTLLDSTQFSGRVNLVDKNGNSLTPQLNVQSGSFPVKILDGMTPDMQALYTLVGGKASLGDMQGFVEQSAGLKFATFADGLAIVSSAKGTFFMPNVFLTKWLEMPQVLGLPVEDAREMNGSIKFDPKAAANLPPALANHRTAIQQFQHGIITYAIPDGWHPTPQQPTVLSAFDPKSMNVLDGAMYAKWKSAGGEATLGAPLTSENVQGNANNTSYQYRVFQNGILFQTATHGVLMIVNPTVQLATPDANGKITTSTQTIDFASAAIGWLKKNPSWLGLPTGEITAAANGGFFWRFDSGTLLWSPSSGLHEVNGRINEHYWGTYGGPNGELGYPMNDQVPEGDLNSYSNGFSNGFMRFFADDGGSWYVTTHRNGKSIILESRW